MFVALWRVLPRTHVCSYVCSAVHSTLHTQAQPHDPENFPFVVLGNKIDEEDGKSRQVGHGRLCVCVLVCACAVCRAKGLRQRWASWRLSSPRPEGC